MGGVRIYSLQFRKNSGHVELQKPTGSQLLRVHQSGSGYWFADCVGPADAQGTEPLDLWLLGERDGPADLDMADLECMGHATSHQGRTAYVFHKRPAPAAPPKRKPGRPKKAATPPPVDADAD